MVFYDAISWLVGLFVQLDTHSRPGSGEHTPLIPEKQKDAPHLETFAETWPNDLGFDTIREERTPITLPVVGHIPLYAAGTIYRNGPGARQLRDASGAIRYSIDHWFDGFAQLHKFDLLPGADGIESIRYSSRFSVDVLMTELTRTGKYSGYTFAQRDPCISTFRKVMCLFTPVPKATPTTANIPVTISANSTGFPNALLPTGHHASKTGYLVARTDEGQVKALDPDTLEPIGIAHQRDLHPLLNGPLSASHAKSDAITGDVFNYNLDLGPSTIYRVFKTAAATGETEILATISSRDVAPAYMHSFFLTENFVILCVWSAHLMAGGLRVLWEKNVLDAIAPFDASMLSKWFVIDRRHGKGVVAAFESPAAFCFHTINAYEVPAASGSSGDVDVVCDLIEYDNLDVLQKFYYENMRSSSPAATQWMEAKQSDCNQHYARYKLASVPSTTALPTLTKRQRERGSPLPAYRPAKLVSTIPNPIAGDMPNINSSHATKPYRYFWNCTFDASRSTFMDGLCKVDTVTGTGIKWENPLGHSPGEVIFLANPDGTEEDDGVLLTIVLDGFNETSYLLCLDARTMAEMGRADCKGVLPFMFHGQHVRDGARPMDI